MTKNEAAFLAQVAMGWFSIHEDGSIWRNVEFSGGGIPTMRWIAPRPAECSQSAECGYPRIMFHHLGERLQVAAHRIVWIHANRQPIPSPMEINHKDGNKSNRNPANLELVTRSENVKHSIHVLGRKKKSQPGEMNAAAKTTARQVAEIRALWAAGAMSQPDLAKRFGLTQSAISAIVTRKSWKHVA